jgi:hypothetical protein
VEPDLLLLELTEERRHCSVACWEKVSGMANLYSRVNSVGPLAQKEKR